METYPASVVAHVHNARMKMVQRPYLRELKLILNLQETATAYAGNPNTESAHKLSTELDLALKQFRTGVSDRVNNPNFGFQTLSHLVGAASELEQAQFALGRLTAAAKG